MRTISSIVGCLLFLCGTIVCFMLAGGPPRALWMPGTIMAIMLAPLGSAILAFGLREVWEAFLDFRWFFVTPSGGAASPRSLVVIRFLLVSTYAMGGLLFLFRLILALGQVGGPSAQLGYQVAVAICSLAYPILIAEGCLRPLRCRLESLADQRPCAQAASGADCLRLS